MRQLGFFAGDYLAGGLRFDSSKLIKPAH